MGTMKTKRALFDIFPPNPPNDGILFVDHSMTGRSGHLGHALVEYAPGKILAFYPNCSDKNKGHSGDGWMEYKRSEDGGRTWGEPVELAYSKEAYANGTGHCVMCEKAVCTADGDILLFNLESTSRGFNWEPLAVPTFLRSSDQGYTWSGPEPVGTDAAGRFSDVAYHQGVVYALKYCNDCKVFFCGNKPEHHYELHVSEDQGRTFTCRSTLSFNAMDRGYGTLAFLSDTELIAYIYNNTDELHPEYAISRDAGKTWEAPQPTLLAKQIRNPQMAAFGDGFVLHGRSGNRGEGEIMGHFVLYTSRDGMHWDEGQYLQMRTAEDGEGLGAYSNNLIAHDPDGGPERLLIQASHAYWKDLTNIHHWWLTAREE